MRSISFALTTAQFLDGSKTVTRRLGWQHLKPGTRLRAVKKAMGLKKGEHPEVLGEIEVLDVRRESLACVRDEETAAEGFPGMTGAEFREMFARHMGCSIHSDVTRIEFRKVDDDSEPDGPSDGYTCPPNHEDE